jgi:hypothetical protein
MPTATYTPLATVTLGTATASVTFSSIPATYRDLILVMNGVGSLSTDDVLRFNSDSGANYNWVRMFGTGSTATSSASASQTYIRNTGNTSPVNSMIIQIMDYSATDKHKTVLSRGDNPAETVMAVASRWANTAAITSVSHSVASGTWTVGSTFNLYGIAS